MVAYSFQRQFVEPIRARTKQQTIRADGKRRHAQAGDDLQLYCGMRTRDCFLIGRALCVDVADVSIRFLLGPEAAIIRITRERPGGLNSTRVIERPRALDLFAHSDGFDGFAAMREFWREHHPGVKEFDGVLIEWDLV